jgi:hypothetical protein
MISVNCNPAVRSTKVAVHPVALRFAEHCYIIWKPHKPTTNNLTLAHAPAALGASPPATSTGGRVASTGGRVASAVASQRSGLRKRAGTRFAFWSTAVDSPAYVHAAFGPVATMKTTELPQPLHCGCPHFSIAHCRWTCAARAETEDAQIFRMTSAAVYRPRGFKYGKAWLSAAWAVIRCAAGHRTSRCTHGLRAVGEP